MRARNLFCNLDKTIDAVLIVNGRTPFLDDNFRYLTDAIGGVFESSIAVVTQSEVTIITSALEGQIALKSGCKVLLAGNGDETKELLGKSMRGKKIVGVNMNGIPHSSMRWIRKTLGGAKLKDVSKQLNRTRMIKDKIEIIRIGKAASIASKAAEEMPELLRLGMTERAAAAEIDYLLRSYGADGPAFETIVAFGPATALPHYRPGNKKLRSGSIVLLDFGASYMNYKSDITRTYFSKPIDRRMANIYGIVAEAQKAAIREIRPGERARRVDMAARKVIEEAGYAKYFIHSTGHGLGISEHDPGVIAERSKDVLRENMVVTVEPGIYIPGKGGVRIEDDVLITKDGGQLLTKTSRDIIAI